MSNNLNDFDTTILNTLSESEKELALSILKDFSTSGNSDKFIELLYQDYEELPVDGNILW